MFTSSPKLAKTRERKGKSCLTNHELKPTLNLTRDRADFTNGAGEEMSSGTATTLHWEWKCLLPDLLRQRNYALWFSSRWPCPGMQKVGIRTVCVCVGGGATEACWVGLEPLQSPSAPSDYITIRARAWAKSTDPHKYKAGRICCYTKIRNNHLHYKNHQKSCHSEWFDVSVQEANSAWRQKPNFT